MNKYVQDEQAIFLTALEQVIGPERDAYLREASPANQTCSAGSDSSY